MNYLVRKFTFLLRRNKGYGVLNIIGLAIGLACSLLVFLWVEDELTYNHHFKNRDNLYKVMQNMTFNGKTNVFPASPPILADYIQGEIPDVTNVVRFSSPTEAVISLDEKQIKETGFYCDSSFFSMFDVQFVYGSPEYAFQDINSIVLSEKTANKFFTGENPIGKTLLTGNEAYRVSAVVKEFPENVSIRFDWLIPFQAWQAQNSWSNGWTGNAINTVVALHPSSAVKSTNEKLAGMLQAHRGNNMIGSFLYNMNDWHLYSDFDDSGLPVGGKLKVIRLFIFIAFIVTLLACINFMNMATAGAMKRAKEVGVLKAVGAGRAVLVRRFLSESMIQVFVSLVMSILIVLCVLPVFNQLISKNLSLHFLSATHIITFIAIFFFCGLLSGMYPAFFLSSFKAVDVLKQLKLPNLKGASAIRQSLVVFQLSASICLIICILVMYGQFMHTNNRNWGYHTEGVVIIPLSENAETYSNVLLQEIRGLATVESAGVSGNMLSSGYKMGAGNFGWNGKAADIETTVCIMDGITGVLSTMGIELADGRDFSEIAGFEAGNVIINQRMAAFMGEEGRLDGEITFQDRNYRITGITKDHIFNNYNALHCEPLIMFCGLNQNRNYRLYVKFKDKANVLSARKSVETLVKPYLEGRYFEYNLLEDSKKYMLRGELSMAKLLTGFSIVSVIITCFGLLCMIAFATEQRIKEIGLRKVFGASIPQILKLLSKDYLILTGISCFIAIPVAWRFMDNWLNNYEYRMPLYWWIFALAGIITLVITWCTVGVQAIRAATANPVKAIKSNG